VTRTILAFAAAAVAAMTFASAAEACISCEYVPEVLKSGNATSHGGSSYSERSYKKSRSYTAAEERKSRKKKVVKSEPKSKKVDTADREPAARKVDTADRAPSKSDAKTENSSISTAAADNSVPTVKKVDTAAVSSSETENSTISTETRDTASVDVNEAPVEEAKVDRNVGCKKFFPTVGMTLSVPCE
jgi:hypothetical protein